MASKYSKTYTTSLKTGLSRITSTMAKRFLLENGYSSSSFHMPEYYNPSGFTSINLAPIDWMSRTGVKITKTLDIITPKGYLSWRSFNFLHPFIYSQLVTEITRRGNWALIKELLTRETLVNCYSTPILHLTRKRTLNAASISNWLQMAEKDLIKDCVEYNFLEVTDIKNFYPSIYTHSISWAVHGKDVAKSRRFDMSLLGNRLDKLIQNSRDGQTNGIPVGSYVSDIIAEIVLCDVDNKLTEQIVAEKLNSNVLIFRFRDDYRILSKTAEQGKRVLSHLNRILNSEYNLSLNSDKTKSYSDIIEGTFRPWILEIKSSFLLRKIYYGDLSDCTSVAYLKDCLVEIYHVQKKYPDSRASLSVLSKLGEELYRKPGKIKLHKGDIPEIISILRKLTLLREEVTPQCFILLDILINEISDKKERRRVLNAIKRVISGNSDYTYQLIWFYRLCLSCLPEMCDQLLRDNNIPLLRVVNRRYFRHDYQIYPNTSFLAHDESELEKFSFIDRAKIRRAKTRKINPNSVNPFNPYRDL